MMSAVLLMTVLGAEGLDLEWNAPDGCPTAEFARARLGAVTGRASVTLSKRDADWSLEVRVGESVRALTSKTCDEAADAAVLIIQLALSPLASVEPPVAAPTPAPAAAGPVSFHLGASASVLLGWLPEPLWRLGAAFSATVGGRLVLLAQLHTGLAQPHRLEDVSPSTLVTTHLFLDAQAGACWAFIFGRARLAPCAVVGLGALSVKGEALLMPRSTVVMLPHASPGLRFTVALTRWLELAVSGWARFSRVPQVLVDGYREVVRPSWLSAELTAGVGGAW